MSGAPKKEDSLEMESLRQTGAGEGGEKKETQEMASDLGD